MSVDVCHEREEGDDKTEEDRESVIDEKRSKMEIGVVMPDMVFGGALVWSPGKFCVNHT